MKTLCVVCPVYNEEAVIGEFYRQLATVLDGLGDRYRSEMLFVVDPSPDRTLDILREVARADPRVRVIVMSARFGHQMALVAGIDHADADAVVMLDSDLQHPPELIPDMVAQYELGHDIVFTVREDSPELGFIKQATSRLFYKVMNLLSHMPIQESAADYRLISRKVANVFRTRIRERNQFLRGLFAWVGYKRTTLRFMVQPRFAGDSKYSVARLFQLASEGLVSFSKRPLHASIFAGFAFAIFAVVIAFWTLYEYMSYDSYPSGFTTLVILISALGGVQLIFLGIIGQYIGAIFDEVKARPHYIVDETFGSAPPDPAAQARSTGL